MGFSSSALPVNTANNKPIATFHCDPFNSAMVDLDSREIYPVAHRQLHVESETSLQSGLTDRLKIARSRSAPQLPSDTTVRPMYALPAHLYQCRTCKRIAPRPNISLLSRLPIPQCRPGHRRHNHRNQCRRYNRVELRLGKSLLRCHPIPLFRLRLVLRRVVTTFVEETEVKLPLPRILHPGWANLNQPAIYSTSRDTRR